MTSDSIAQPKWNHHRFTSLYTKHLEEMLVEVSSNSITLEKAGSYVNDLSNNLCDAMKRAERVSSGLFKQQTKREKYWWNKDCTKARNRCRLFHSIWSSMGRPKFEQAYNCYKDSRKCYKRTCRMAVNRKTGDRFKVIDKMSKANKSGKMWNIIRK